MTVSTTTNRWDYTGDASTVAFTYDNKIFASGDLRVYLDGVLQSSGYTVSGAGSAAGGLVTFSVAPGSAVAVAIVRRVADTQTLDLVPFDAFPADAVEGAVDRRAIVSQQLAHDLDRTLILPEDEAAGTTTELPSIATRASKFLGFDALGNVIAGIPSSVSVIFSDIGQELATAASKASALVTLGLDTIDILASGASNFRWFQITGASSAFEDYDGAGGTTLTDYDIQWMDGWWFGFNLRKNTDLNVPELITDDVAIGFHITKNTFPFEPFKAVTIYRIQSTTAREAVNNNHKPGIDDAVIWPGAGSVGGFEMVATFGSNGTIAFGGKGPEYDGDGAVPFARSMHAKIGGKVYSGMVVNAYIDFSGTDRAVRPSNFFGFRWDEDGTGDREWVELYEAPQDAGAAATANGTSAVTWTEVAAYPVATGPLSAELELDPYAVNSTIGPTAHGLGGMPTGYDLWLECKTAELNWAVGDRVAMSPGAHNQVSGSNGHVDVAVDAATVEVVTANNSAPAIANRTTRALTTITPAKWKLVVVVRRER